MNFALKVGDVDVPRHSQYCKFIEEGNCFVRSDGNIAPCKGLLHNGKTYLDGIERTIYSKTFGNIKTQNLEEIWLSDEYIEFRERVLDFSFSPCLTCGKCHLVRTTKRIVLETNSQLWSLPLGRWTVILSLISLTICKIIITIYKL